METMTISAKGWLVIPADLRKKYDLKPGSRVRFVDYGGVISIIPERKDAVNAARGMLKGKPSLLKALQAEKRLEREREK